MNHTLVLSALFGSATLLLGGITVLYRYFYVHVDPDEFVVHYRGGRILHIGRGISFFALPYDTYLKVPGTLRDVNFCADQVTKERQGVRVQGFIAYKIVEIAEAYQSLDFKARSVQAQVPCSENIHLDAYEEKNRSRTVVLDPSDPLAKTDYVLRQLAESVVRDEVSNRTLDEMVSARKQVIDSMRGKLLEVANGWGLSIETIEFTEVWIRSKEVFENLQAGYRNKIRFDAEESTFQTRREIEEKRIETERELARMEAEADRVRRIKTAEEQALASQTELSTKQDLREREIELERRLREVERENKHRGAIRDMELAKDRELTERQNQLALQAENHQIEMDQRQKEEELKRREGETAKTIQLLGIETEVESALKRAEKERAEAKNREEQEEAEARLKEIQVRGRAEELLRMARARKDALLEEAEGIQAKGEAEARAIQATIEAKNTVNARTIQRELVSQISEMAQHMKVNDVNWINIAGDKDQSPLGIIPRNILETVSIFKGLGMGLEDVVSGRTPTVDTTAEEPES